MPFSTKIYKLNRTNTHIRNYMIMVSSVISSPTKEQKQALKNKLKVVLVLVVIKLERERKAPEKQTKK